MKSMTERHVQAIWYDAALRPANLVTRRGQSVAVLSPGEWNLGAGPDFRRAVLEIGPGRRRVVGDVEVHLAPGDWDLHGHGSDPNYRNVVAHVTWRCGPDPASLPPGAVSIWLGRLMATGGAAFAPEQVDLSAYPFARLPLDGRPCERALEGDPDRARALLASAGRRRLAMKARRLAGRLCERTRQARQVRKDAEVPRDAVEAVRRQVFYEEVMAALGYSRNSAPFRRVAERVPFDALPREREAAQNAFLVAGAFETWDRGSSRPRNAPERRLAGAAAAFSETGLMSLREAAGFSKAECRAMLATMCGGLRRGDGGETGRIMGRGRAAAIVANVVAPFAIAEDRLVEAPDWLPPEDVSEPVRLTAFRLFGRDHNPAALYSTNGLLIQGLIQVHRDFCRERYPDCGGCGLPAAG